MSGHHYVSMELSAGRSLFCLMLLHCRTNFNITSHMHSKSQLTIKRVLLHVSAVATKLLQSARQASAANCRLENPVMKHLIQGAYGW